MMCISSTLRSRNKDRERSRTSGRGNDISGSFDEMDYIEFLKSKIEIAKDSGFEVGREEINPALKPHQKDAVIWALRGGRRALFESFGLGKTAQELEFCHQAVRRFGKKALIVCPLGVKQEFQRDAAELLGYEAPRYVRNMDEVKAAPESILITNYERVRDGDIQPDYFTATSLDEASVLRSFGSKTYQTFLDKFKGVPCKLVATATPSPNRYKELIHYAGYLEVMDTGQALTRFFQRDSTKANNLTLYPNMEDEFWLWVSSWALFITKPSDVNSGYSDEGYVLPPLEVRWHELPIHYGDTTDRDGQFQLFNNAAVGLKEAAQVKRESIDRCVERKESVDSDPDAHFILWHDLEREREAIKKALPETFMVVAPGSWTWEVWDDINRMRTLNTTQSRRRAQMHVCPLQLDIVERIINRYSNEGDLVYDPFGGLMTVPMMAIKMKRRGYGCELNPDYFRDGVGYLQAAEEEVEAPTLFDFMGVK